jgi:hypothetical protein
MTVLHLPERHHRGHPVLKAVPRIKMCERCDTRVAYARSVLPLCRRCDRLQVAWTLSAIALCTLASLYALWWLARGLALVWRAVAG